LYELFLGLPPDCLSAEYFLADDISIIVKKGKWKEGVAEVFVNTLPPYLPKLNQFPL
jgi:hypothetical protein